MINTKSLFLGLAVLSLVACLASPVLYFVGSISMELFTTAFLITSVIYFVFALLWQRARSESAGREKTAPLSD